jgi:hypothetical protein
VFGGDYCRGIRRSQRQDLPDGATMPLGKFQKDLRLRQSLSLKPEFGTRLFGANRKKERERMRRIFQGILAKCMRWP